MVYVCWGGGYKEKRILALHDVVPFRHSRLRHVKPTLQAGFQDASFQNAISDPQTPSSHFVLAVLLRTSTIESPSCAQAVARSLPSLAPFSFLCLLASLSPQLFLIHNSRSRARSGPVPTSLCPPSIQGLIGRRTCSDTCGGRIIRQSLGP